MVDGLRVIWRFDQLSTSDGSLIGLSADASCHLGAQLDFQMESLYVVSLGNLPFNVLIAKFPEES